MRTIAAAIVLAAVIVVVGLRWREVGPAGSDGKPLPDVVWTDEEPYCPHCRTDVNWYATVCYTCYHEFRWKPAEVPCRFCVDEELMARFRKAREHGADLRQALASTLDGLGLPADVVAATVPDLMLWVERMKVGACGFCAGTGRRLAPATVLPGREEGDSLFDYAVEVLGDTCPVCLGTGKCLACGGDHSVSHGIEAASLEATRLYGKLENLEPGFRRESDIRWFDLTKEYLQRFAGAWEIEDMGSVYSSSHQQMTWAADRLQSILDILPEAD